ncbi:MAG: protein BatD, partial [Acidobacteria bacterium]|nr:protein BatD [Acidobacteriota bacterium]
ADRDAVSPGEEFRLTVEVRGPRAVQARPPDLSRLPGVRVLGLPSVQSRYQWINGRSAYTRSFHYTLLPDREGILEIPPVAVRAGDMEATASGVRIRVEPGSGALPRSPAARESPGETGAGREVRAIAEVDRQEVFQGEQVSLRFLIRSPAEVRGLELVEQPEFPGFWVEEIPPDPDHDVRQVRRDGESYIEYTVMRRALFPGRAGELTIEPAIFAVTVPRSGRDPFPAFLFESRQTLHRSTERIGITVRPLPAAHRPEEFRGAVGDFRLELSSDRNRLTLQDAVTVRVTARGRGNLSTLDPPLFQPPEEFRLHDPKVTREWSAADGTVSGRKTWEYILIPRTPGQHTIPPARLVFFDPEASAYRTARSSPLSLQVEGAEGAFSRGGHGELVARERDIHFLKGPRAGGLRGRSRPAYRSPVTLAALFVPAAGNAILYLVLLRRRRAAANRSRLRHRRAWRRARRALGLLERQRTLEGTPFFDALASVLYGYVADKFDLAASGLTRSRLLERLGEAGVPPSVAEDLCACLEGCDRARFGRGPAGRPDRDDLMARSRRALERMEARL